MHMFSVTWLTFFCSVSFSFSLPRTYDAYIAFMFSFSHDADIAFMFPFSILFTFTFTIPTSLRRPDYTTLWSTGFVLPFIRFTFPVRGDPRSC